MKRSVRAIDRVLVGLLGAALLAVGLWLIGYRMRVGRVVSDTHRLDPAWLSGAPGQQWWPVALGVGGVLLILVSAWLLLAHLRVAATTVPCPGGSLDVAALADAAADDLTRHRAISRARARTRRESGRVVVRIRATVAADADPTELGDLARDTHRKLVRAAGPEVAFQLLADRGRKPAARVDHA